MVNERIEKLTQELDEEMERNTQLLAENSQRQMELKAQNNVLSNVYGTGKRRQDKRNGPK